MDTHSTEPVTHPAARIYVGPAGWSYPDWDRVVYPRPVVRDRRQLQWLSQWFELVEVNSTFYRLPALANVRRWMDAVRHNPRFRFTVKLHQRFTHGLELDRGQVRSFCEMLDLFHQSGLLGCALAQFPWSFKCEREEKIHLRRLLDAFQGFPLAVEVRHASWDTPAFFEYLQRRAVAFCNIDQPVIGQSLGPTCRVTSRQAYLRLHGRNEAQWFDDAGSAQRYNYLYSEDEIGAIADLARRLATGAEELYVVTNNHYRGKAVLNGRQLCRRLIPEDDRPLLLSEDEVR